MGCFYSLLSYHQTEYLFTAEEVKYLNSTWNILKTRCIINFADEVLLRSINQNSDLRRFWISKVLVDGNNLDYSQGESCIRTDLSWQIGLREHRAHLILTFDNLISAINSENHFSKRIQSLPFFKTVSTLESDSLIILKKCIVEVIRERFQAHQLNFTNEYEQAWDKFLSVIFKFLLERHDKKPKIMKNTVSPIIIIEPPPSNA